MISLTSILQSGSQKNGSNNTQNPSVEVVVSIRCLVFAQIEPDLWCPGAALRAKVREGSGGAEDRTGDEQNDAQEDENAMEE